ncbi:ubiquitin-conjugating enzyme [Xylaria sp. CBS 124048]|nr:ubiquitin-conjugating enzyme [Xylaria sp. CBS 124048]
MSDQSIIRITKELHELKKNSDLSLAVAVQDRDLRNIKALIIGPHDTPYEFGFFEFSFRFNREYPRKSPAVTCTTTNAGRCRFNPNIYANGKVCLSILGTWRGESGEEWSAAQGLESILLSIQSLLSSNPYENEPGFEGANQEHDKTFQKQYVSKIRHETLRISVIQKLEEFCLLTKKEPCATPSAGCNCHPINQSLANHDDDEDESNWEPFRDLYKRRFLWYYETYLETIQKEKIRIKDGSGFHRMPFEGANNAMDGRFYYNDLEKRLRRIKAFLDAEPEQWEKEGVIAKNQDGTVSVNLNRQFDQIKEAFKRDDIPHNIELENGNPFSWVLTYFGRPMTNFDGGMFRIKMSFSPRFPAEQPRVKFLTNLYHHRVTPDGILCYIPSTYRSDDVRQHIEAIFTALEEENPPYDPRTRVHPEAHRLYWGGPEDRKTYNRKLRRSVQRSMEDF